MKFSSILSAALVAILSVQVEAVPPVKRQTQSSIAVTGVTGSGVQPRMELRQMQAQNPDMFNLYLLGLRRMMNVKQTDPLSYYQIAGIHGRPYIPWDGVASKKDGGYGGGYCTHVSNIFLTWHRPYLALFEQTLYSHVQAVANTFPANTKQRYLNAAKNFRIPYWDWAAPPCSGCLPYPRLVSQQYLTVDTPTGRQTVLNPLFRYDFQGAPSNDFVYDPFASWTVTKRFPTSWALSGYSQNDQIAPQIANNRANWADRIYNLLTTSTNFTEFSTEAWYATSSGGNTDSLESIHDAIHAIVGSNGHMTYLDYSAFDPIFYLHHAQIDRIWAIWSAIHDGKDGNPSFVQPMNSTGTTYMYDVNTPIDSSFPLSPFHKDTNRNLYTSNDVRDPTKLGYTYPELVNANSASINTAVNKLYGSSVSASQKRDLVALSKRSDSHHYHYIANIVSQKFQMNGSYAVYMFLGTPSDDAKSWPTASNLVGTHGVFSNMQGKDSVGMSGMDIPVTGTVPLTTTLLNKCSSGELKDLDPTTVTPYLQSNLNWRVALFDGTEVDVNDVPDLSVSVVISDVSPPATDADLPTWGHFESLPEITQGKAGGFNEKFWSSGTTKVSLGELIGSGMTGRSVSFNY